MDAPSPTAAIGLSRALREASYSVLTPYLVPPGPKKVNVGDGFILDSATKLLGARPVAAFSSRVPLSQEDLERINSSRALIAVGANTLKDDFELTPRFDLATLERVKVPVILMGVGHYGIAERTRGLSPASVALFRALLERFPSMSVRCDASRAYVLASMPDQEGAVAMTSCPVVHAVDGIDRGFARKERYDRLVVTITDRGALEQQLPLLQVAPQVFPAERRVLALHQDYGNPQLWDYAKRLGYEVLRGDDMRDFLALYEASDVHLGNRVHAHLKCLSLGVRSYCTPFDLRQAFFAQSLDYPLVERLPDPRIHEFDFERVVARRAGARLAMDHFVTQVRSIVGITD